MSTDSPIREALPLAPVAAPMAAPRRLNPFGAYSIGLGIVTCLVAGCLFANAAQATTRDVDGDKLNAVGWAIGAMVYLAAAAAACFCGCVGGVAALFGMVRRPRWQGLVGLTLNVGVPVALFFVAQYVRNR